MNPVFSWLGASGAGKTTLRTRSQDWSARNLMQSPEFEGWQLYQGSETAIAKMRNSRVGFVFQGYFLLPELTALENVTLPSMIGGKARPEEAKAALDQVGLAHRMHHLPAELSGGEQQRVAIARAVINNPSIIFADEPTGNLDSKTGDGIMDLLLALAHEKKKTLVVVTHDALLAGCMLTAGLKS